MLITCLSAIGETTKAVTLATAGTLSTLIDDDEKNTITSLTVSGPINSDDVATMKSMVTNGALSVIDMSEATTDNTDLIRGYVLQCCSKLTSISLPKGITSIGYMAFDRCTGLTSVIIPDGVARIGGMAFWKCTSLTSVTIPQSVTSIDGAAFYDCRSLNKVIVKDIAAWSGISFYDYSTNPLYYAKHLYSDENTEIKDLEIPDGVSSIGQYAFCYCTGLTSVTIPQSVTSIAKCAFDNCSGLTSATIGSGVTSIGESAFYHCSGLTSVAIPDKVTSIGKMAFDDCTGLTSVSLPESLTTIGAAAFASCKGLTSVNIPNSVTSIGSSAFQECSSLTTVNIPSSVTSIERKTFYECTSLTSITIPANVTNIGEEAFRVCYNLKEVTLQGKALPTTEYGIFNDINLTNATLYCKAALVEKCQSTEPWSGFGTKKAKPFSITISDAGIATGCFDDDLDFSEVTGVKAYIVSAFSPTESKVLLTRATKIPAETGFIVIGSAGTYEIPAVATDYIYSNMLVGVLENTTVAKTTDSYTNYVLGKDDEGVAGFYLLANETAVPANKAYLQLPTSAVTTDGGSDAKTSLRLSFDDMDDTTGITHVREKSDSASGKTVIYNLNGQRKQSLTKGLNIVNGKKIFVK